MWAQRGTRSAQAALSPPPLQPKQGREAPEEGNISNIPVVMLHEVRTKGLFLPYLFSSLKGKATAVVVGLGRTATLWPPLVTSMTLGRVPPPERVDPTVVFNGAAGPQAPLFHDRAIQAAGSR